MTKIILSGNIRQDKGTPLQNIFGLSAIRMASQ